jgi:predicted HTH domain antitoxin
MSNDPEVSKRIALFLGDKASEEKIEAVKELFEAVTQGYVSVRRAAVLLDCTVDDICEVAFGEIVL